MTFGNQLTDLPDGFEFRQAGNGDLLFTVETASDDDIGEYTIEIRGSLDDGP